MADMLVAERYEQIVRELGAFGGLKVTELAARLGVSRATVRRDLLDLESAGRVIRVRGGAMLAPQESGSVSRPAGVAPAASTAAADARRPAPERPLGLLVPSATYYYPRVVEGVQAVVGERQARVIISLSGYGEANDAQAIEELVAAGAVGLLIASPGGHYLSPQTFDLLTASGLPFVLIERQPADVYAPCEFVVTDHRQGAYTAVRHLADQGHDAVALFTNGSPTADLIREGHTAAVERLALKPTAPVLDSGYPTLGSEQADQYYGQFLDACQESGVRAALVHSDHDAIELMRRMRARGLRAPHDLALIAYDDEIAALADVPLTSVAPPKHEVGAHAARLLLDRLDAPDAVPIRQMFLQPRLVVRASSGTARS
ncbi:substrate-binding domain-containing protein [Streptomyces sp. NPDC059787]|uniref:substrate-binding domain-containing protein n=1 Tax=Streptomyces sp. NPDC059787 TaxID=3346947 RepID=UPI003663A6FF